MFCGLIWSCRSRSVPAPPSGVDVSPPQGWAVSPRCSPFPRSRDKIPGHRSREEPCPAPSLPCPVCPSSAPVPFLPFGHSCSSLFPKLRVPIFPSVLWNTPVPLRVPGGVPGWVWGLWALLPPFAPGALPEQRCGTAGGGRSAFQGWFPSQAPLIGVRPPEFPSQGSPNLGSRCRAGGCRGGTPRIPVGLRSGPIPGECGALGARLCSRAL